MHGLPLPLFAAGAVPPPLVWIDDQTVSAAANVEITWGGQAFEDVFILSDNINPSVANTGLYLRTSSDNGATFDASAGDYEHMLALFQTGFYKESGQVTALQVIPNGATYGLRLTGYGSFMHTIHRPYNASERTSISGIGGWRTVNANVEATTKLYGFRDGIGRVNGVQYTLNSGLISGRFQAWGIAA